MCHDDVTSFHDGCDNDVVNSYRIVSYKDKRQVMPVVVPSYTIT